MGNMFLSVSRPFYQSVSMMYLESIALPAYTAFVSRHFEQGAKMIVPEVVELIYWQKMLNVLYSLTPPGGNCTQDMIPTALNNVMDFFIYLSGNVIPDA